MSGFTLNADTQVIRKQLVTIVLEVGMVETGIDVVEIMLVTPNGQPRRVSIPSHRFDSYDKNY